MPLYRDHHLGASSMGNAAPKEGETLAIKVSHRTGHRFNQRNAATPWARGEGSLVIEQDVEHALSIE